MPAYLEAKLNKIMHSLHRKMYDVIYLLKHGPFEWFVIAIILLEVCSSIEALMQNTD